MTITEATEYEGREVTATFANLVKRGGRYVVDGDAQVTGVAKVHGGAVSIGPKTIALGLVKTMEAR